MDYFRPSSRFLPLVVGLSVAFLASAFLITACSSPRLSIKVNEEITFHLVKILTSANAPDDSISGGKIHPDHNFARLIFKADYPQDWTNGDNVDEVIKSKFNPAMVAANMTDYRTCFRGGVCSGHMNTGVYADENHNVSRVYLALDLIDIPVTLETIQFQLFKFGENSTIKTFSIQNPVYVPVVEPLTIVDQLPVAHTDQGVTVTLNRLVAKMSDDAYQRDSQGNSAGRLFGNERYMRAEGTQEDPFRSFALVTIDDGTSDTYWKIHELKMQYGKDLYPLVRSGRWWEQPSYGQYEPEPSRLITFPLDISVVQQPVKLSLSLMHPEDEKKIRHFEFTVTPTEADIPTVSTDK